MKSCQQSIILCLLAIQWSICGSRASDITSNAFGNVVDGVVSAFGDFNSDELTDVFITSNKGKTLEILLASDVEPLLRQSVNTRCDFKDLKITSVVPGDFDGDAYMDLMITTRRNSDHYEHKNSLDVYINWGGVDYLNCTDEHQDPLIRMRGEPVALDYNRDMIIDLFGLDDNGVRTFWLFGKDRKEPKTIVMPVKKNSSELSIPHAHAYLDLNNDFTADLFVSTQSDFEIWLGRDHEGFTLSESIKLPKTNFTGQSIFLDIELTGIITQILPICHDDACNYSAIVARVNGEYIDLKIDFKDDMNQEWKFIKPKHKPDEIYQNTITLRGGDFNLDGYPDLLVTLAWRQEDNHTQTFLMENVACKHCSNGLTRTFEVRWRAFAPFANGTVVGAFYDFYQDGILDVIFVEKQINTKSKPLAFRNTLDYDANFVKVIVLTGLTNRHAPTKLTPLGRKKRTYGTNLPGPRIAYYTTKPDGDKQESTSVQIPQSAYFSLHLPYTIFGLGRTPNFVDKLTVGLSHQNRTWTQLIPNSQMVVVPWPPDEPSRWKAQLFVTPSKLIWMSVLSLGATCAVITLIILVLDIKERREDKLERLQETERFHFDAM